MDNVDDMDGEGRHPGPLGLPMQVQGYSSKSVEKGRNAALCRIVSLAVGLPVARWFLSASVG
jgi:hypothetical protein